MVPEMTRAHPPLHLSAVLAAAMALAGLACNSDDREQLTGTTSGTTEVDPTVIPVFTTGEPVDTTVTPEVPVPTVTCRKAVYCVNQCLLKIEKNDFEAKWQGCLFDNCLEKLTTAEWLKLFDLVECAVDVCSARTECISGSSDDCNVCYLAMLSAVPPNTPPHGDGLCDAVSLACD